MTTAFEALQKLANAMDPACLVEKDHPYANLAEPLRAALEAIEDAKSQPKYKLVTVCIGAEDNGDAIFVMPREFSMKKMARGEYSEGDIGRMMIAQPQTKEWGEKIVAALNMVVP